MIQQLVADSAATVYEITETTVRQTVVHDRALGRVTSTFSVMAGLAQLTATLGAGLLAEAIGLRATIWLAPLGGLIGAAVLWRSPVRTLMALPDRPGGHDLNAEGGPLVATAAAAVDIERDRPIGG